VALEALNNALRHAQAENVSISIHRQDNQLSMVVEDDGRGFDVETGLEAGGLGLGSMRRRIAKINGAIAFDSLPGQGTRIKITTLLPDD
jgi:signal transduction histidine kinase